MYQLEEVNQDYVNSIHDGHIRLRLINAHQKHMKKQRKIDRKLSYKQKRKIDTMLGRYYNPIRLQDLYLLMINHIEINYRIIVTKKSGVLETIHST